jgi:hypothetical protein
VKLELLSTVQLFNPAPPSKLSRLLAPTHPLVSVLVLVPLLFSTARLPSRALLWFPFRLHCSTWRGTLTLFRPSSLP